MTIMEKQRVAVIGIGYVGTVTAACLSDAGHQVVGVDISNYKVDSLNSGRAPLSERGLSELIAKNHAAGRLSATSDVNRAVENSDVALICVGTPSNNLRHTRMS